MKEPKYRWLDRRIAAPGPFLALCLSQEEFRDAMTRLKSPEIPSFVSPNANATTHIFNHEKGGVCCVVCMRGWEGKNPIEVAGMLVHEAVHVWQAYAEGIGEKYEGAEQEAYAIQAVAQELMAEFARRMGDK